MQFNVGGEKKIYVFFLSVSKILLLYYCCDKRGSFFFPSRGGGGIGEKKNYWTFFFTPLHKTKKETLINIFYIYFSGLHFLIINQI